MLPLCLQGELSVGIMASFIGYTFTLTFAVSPILLFHYFKPFPFSQLCLMLHVFQVQGLVNTFGDLRETFAAVERINSVLSGVEIDKALAYSLEREMGQTKRLDESYKLFLDDSSDDKNHSPNFHYMSALKSTSSVGCLASSGDVCLEGIHAKVLFYYSFSKCNKTHFVQQKQIKVNMPCIYFKLLFLQ